LSHIQDLGREKRGLGEVTDNRFIEDLNVGYVNRYLQTTEEVGDRQQPPARLESNFHLKGLQRTDFRQTPAPSSAPRVS